MDDPPHLDDLPMTCNIRANAPLPLPYTSRADSTIPGPSLAYPQADPCKQKSAPQYEYYDMNNPRRGVAAIFNHQTFDVTGVKERRGSQHDVDNLTKTFTWLGFKVEVHVDLTWELLEYALEELSERDYSDCDCIALIFMTHGQQGRLRCRDKIFKMELLWGRFSDERCPSLTDKPKLFIIQACLGGGEHKAVRVAKSDVDSPKGRQIELVPSYSLPDQPDVLIVFCTIPGTVCWRRRKYGSVFVQTLCKQLNIYGFKEDLLTLLTRVARSVVMGFKDSDKETQIHYKQLPLLVSFLTRTLKFTPAKEKRIDGQEEDLTTDEGNGATQQSFKRFCADEERPARK